MPHAKYQAKIQEEQPSPFWTDHFVYFNFFLRGVKIVLKVYYFSFHKRPCLAVFSTIFGLLHDFIHYVVFSSLISSKYSKLRELTSLNIRNIVRGWIDVALTRGLLRFWARSLVQHRCTKLVAAMPRMEG